MERKSTGPHEVDAEIAHRAARQHGILSRSQLLAAGLGPETIRSRCRHGRLHRLHTGVYAVGFLPMTPLARLMAAVLACGERAALSHRSAAALWGFAPSHSGPVDVLAAGRHRRAGIHSRQGVLTARDVTTQHGIPVTAPTRTLVDLADCLDDRALTRAVNEARIRGLVTPGKLADQLARSPGRCAITRLSRHVDPRDAPTRSVFEDQFLLFARRCGLPAPRVNQRVATYEVDLLWAQERLIVELDGRTYHGHADAFERDRERDADLVAAGYRVIRITWARLTREPAREAARLRALLQRPV